jgi:hypothetical protein
MCGPRLFDFAKKRRVKQKISFISRKMLIAEAGLY